jgi:uncharacterized protein
MSTDRKKEPNLAIFVSALYFYPIKSCGGISLEVAKISQRGIRGDRAFMVVDLTGRFMTQRKQPRMALIQPSVREDGVLTVTAPNMPEMSIVADDAGKRYNVEIWNDTCVSVDQGDAIATWFSTFLGIACRVVYMPEDYVRQVNPQYAIQEQDQVAFADGYPFLLVTEASLADLNTRMQEPLPMNRFRPNIVLEGTLPYVEDTWRKIWIGEVLFYIAKTCERCPITTTDQATAVVGKEPLRTLATYRRTQKGVVFGQNLIHAHEGIIRLGDTVEVVENAATANFSLRVNDSDTNRTD